MKFWEQGAMLIVNNNPDLAKRLQWDKLTNPQVTDAINRHCDTHAIDPIRVDVLPSDYGYPRNIQEQLDPLIEYLVCICWIDEPEHEIEDYLDYMYEALKNAGYIAVVTLDDYTLLIATCAHDHE